MKHHIHFMTLVVGLLCASCVPEDQDCTWGYIPLPGKNCRFWRYTITQTPQVFTTHSFTDNPFDPDALLDIYILQATRCGVDTLGSYAGVALRQVPEAYRTLPFQVQLHRGSLWYQAALSKCPETAHIFVSTWTNVCSVSGLGIP